MHFIAETVRKKGRLILMLSVYILLGVMLAFYTAGAAFILCFGKCSRVCGGGLPVWPHLFLPYLKRDRFCFPQELTTALPIGPFP